MKHLLIITALIINLSLYGQHYAVGTQTLSYSDGTRSNRAISADVHYPALATGASTPFANDSFPIIIFGHGFQMTASAYTPYADTLASRGYIVVLSNTETSILPNHTNFAQDLIYLYNTVIAENANSASPFFHKIIARGAIGGHSMGGGCTVLSAQFSNPATCYFTFAEATTNPSSITAAPSMTKPYLSFAGSYDCIAPYGTNQQPTYDSSGSPCKYLIEITGASHCQFGAGNVQCNLGEGISGCANPPLSRTAQINTTLAYLLPYLDHYLRNSASAQTTFDSVYTADAVNIKTKSCTTLPSGIEAVSTPGFFIYPNPACSQLNIVSADKIAEVKVWDLAGRLQIRSQFNTEKSMMDISSLAVGEYLLQMTNAEGLASYRHFSKK